ncbi:MAG: DUF3365 domain-containing protein [Bacteroidia bacterium]
MFIRYFATALISALVFSSCKQETKTVTIETVETEVEATDFSHYSSLGDSITKVAFTQLSSRLKSVIDTAGFSGAVDYCSVHAIPLTSEVAEKYGVTLSRISNKYRNPFNIARNSDGEILDAMATDVKPSVIEDAESVTYYKPIKTMALCLNCHGKEGETLNEEAYAAIKSKYPEDLAVGYSEGELRGAWKVVFSK